ncbi:MAG: cyclase family protein [Actinobacteria bacterium]|nr:cyclase family protein [Actinomycetota bacterium]
MARYIDISIPTDALTTVFPGDPAPEISWPAWSHEKGNPANVGFFHGGLHHGTHVDAPWHFIPGGKRLHEMPLEHWVGECQVLDLTAEEECITAESLEKSGVCEGMKRLLFKTRNSRTDYWREPWNPDFIYIHKSAAEWCAAHSLLLIGLDYLTIDSPKEPTFPAHLELLGHETLILENINLRHVEAQTYELVAAPINLQGVDGAWTRALLRSE